MPEKRVIVYLDTGAIKEHILEVENDDVFIKEYNEYLDVLNSDRPGLLVFGTPFCIYKVQNIIALGISEPPPLNDKLPIGFIAKKQ